MTIKTLEFTLSIKVEESAVSQVKDIIVGSEAKHPPLAERLVSLVKEKLSEMGVAGEVTGKLDYGRTIGRSPGLQGGLNPQEWSNKADQPGSLLSD